MSSRIGLLAVLLAIATTSKALDTTEPFDPGFSDLEIYAGYSGMDSPSSESVVCSEMLVGAGLTSTLSSFVVFSFQSDGYLGQAQEGVGIGLFWTVRDGSQFDIDLYASTGSGGAVSAGTEINWDSGDWGIQINVEETLENGGAQERTESTFLQPLAHLTLSDGVEILCAVDLLYADSDDGEKEMDWSTISAGLNFPVLENIEGITQFDLINSGDDETDVGISVGLVAGV